MANLWGTLDHLKKGGCGGLSLISGLFQIFFTKKVAKKKMGWGGLRVISGHKSKTQLKKKGGRFYDIYGTH